MLCARKCYHHRRLTLGTGAGLTGTHKPTMWNLFCRKTQEETHKYSLKGGPLQSFSWHQPIDLEAMECISHWPSALHLACRSSRGDRGFGSRAAVLCSALSATGLAGQWRWATELMDAGRTSVMSERLGDDDRKQEIPMASS